MAGVQFAVQQQDATFPRVYRPGALWRIFILLISFLLGVAVAVPWYFGAGRAMRTGNGGLFFDGLYVLLALVSAYLVAWLFVARLTLWPDRIERRDVIRTRTLYRRDIIGHRMVYPSRSQPRLVLVPRSSSARQLEISNIFGVDALFNEWVDSLPDLDAEDQLAARQEILNNQELGTTPDDRLAALNRGQGLARLLAGVSVALGVWGWFYPVPFPLVIALLVLLPCVGLVIVARSNGLFRIGLDGNRNDPHPNVALPVLVPSVVLMLRVAHDMRFLQWTGVFWAAAGLAALLTLAAVMADRSLQSRPGMIILFFMFSMFYAFGASMEGNALLDRSQPSLYPVQIADKEIRSGKGRGYHLYFVPWGPKLDNDDVPVSRSFYDSVRIGDIVCVSLHQGAFHVPWYIVQPCSPAILPEPGN